MPCAQFGAFALADGENAVEPVIIGTRCLEHRRDAQIIACGVDLIGLFRIASEQGIASGVRRIEANTGGTALAEVETAEDLLLDSAALVRGDKSNLVEKIQGLLDQNKKLEKLILEKFSRVEFEKDLMGGAIMIAAYK